MENKKGYFINEDQFNTIYQFVKSLKSDWIGVEYSLQVSEPNQIKTDQEMNNLRMAIAEDKKAIKNLTEKLDAARKSKYHNSIILYQAENDVKVGDTIKWEWKPSTEKHGFEGLNDEPLPEPIGEITHFSCTDYTGIQIHVKCGVKQVILTKDNTIKKLNPHQTV